MLIVLQGPKKSGKSTLVNLFAYLGQREVRRVEPLAEIPWESQAVYYTDVPDDAMNLHVLEWAKREGERVDLVLETRRELPSFSGAAGVYALRLPALHA